MSWIDDIKLVRWLNNGVASAQVQGANLIGLGATAVDNPNFSTTLADGSVVKGRTEIIVPPPNQPLLWFAAAAPAVAAERWITNYGAYSASVSHAKIVARRFAINAISWRSQVQPAEAITLKLYHNGAAAGVTWQLVIPGGATNYYAELRPTVPFITGGGCVIGISLTQAGVSAVGNMRAIISVT